MEFVPPNDGSLPPRSIDRVPTIYKGHSLRHMIDRHPDRIDSVSAEIMCPSTFYGECYATCIYLDLEESAVVSIGMKSGSPRALLFLIVPGQTPEIHR